MFLANIIYGKGKTKIYLPIYSGEFGEKIMVYLYNDIKWNHSEELCTDMKRYTEYI